MMIEDIVYQPYQNDIRSMPYTHYSYWKFNETEQLKQAEWVGA